MTAELVKLHDGRPTLNDVPGRLRFLAGQIESGEFECDGAIVLLPRQGDYPRVLGFGNIEGTNDPLIQLELAKHWFISNVMVRK